MIQRFCRSASGGGGLASSGSAVVAVPLFVALEPAVGAAEMHHGTASARCSDRDFVGPIVGPNALDCGRFSRQGVAAGAAQRPQTLDVRAVCECRTVALQAGGHRFDPGWLHSHEPAANTALPGFPRYSSGRISRVSRVRIASSVRGATLVKRVQQLALVDVRARHKMTL